VSYVIAKVGGGIRLEIRRYTLETNTAIGDFWISKICTSLSNRWM